MLKNDFYLIKYIYIYIYHTKPNVHILPLIIKKNANIKKRLPLNFFIKYEF